MGVSSSVSIADLDSNESLTRLVGDERIEEGLSFWDELLSFYFTVPENRGDARVLEEATRGLCKRMTHNNPVTGNLSTLVRLFIERASHLANDEKKQEDNVYTWQVYNAVFLIRSLVKYFTENLSEDEVSLQFSSTKQSSEVTPSSSSQDTPETQTVLVNGEVMSPLSGAHVSSSSTQAVGGDVGNGSIGQVASRRALCPLLCELLDSLLTSLCDIPVVSFTYGIKVEIINTLLVFLSRQLWSYVYTSSDISLILHHILSVNSRQSAAVVRTLLINFVHHDVAPPADIRMTRSGVFSSISSAASSLWSYFVGPKTTVAEQRETPLADLSLLLFLVLTNHHTRSEGQLINPYRRAMRNFADLRGQVNQQKSEVSFVLQLDQLYFALCRDLKQDQAILLLYMLLHENTNMAAFIFSRSDVENLVLPILKLLYSPEQKNSHLVYMALIVLLMFSEDDGFNRSIHEIKLSSVPWYNERQLSQVTLGDLLVLVLIRTIQHNIATVRDKYLHTNSLAALANMSANLRQLHQYVAQRIVDLFQLLARRHKKMAASMRRAPEQPDSGQDYVADLPIVDEVMRMVLEIINSCLTHSLHHNPNLVYALLRQHELFAEFRTNATFQDVVQNIETVVGYFNSKLDRTTSHSVYDVQLLIEEASRSWPRDRLKRFPELKFRYVEEEQPEEFFVPYVWSLVYHCSGLYWDPLQVVLFSLQRDE
ncbi:dymeclin-like isoform X2 [Corticium candelabrum]|uniref:dymeclin-like isoform X2 n=1 Tax=Corticium candelabrum TaxID=121492 RepID=UPI002E252786|nr:dymeclin-like isoform X2 [Corticium candelabrum]